METASPVMSSTTSPHRDGRRRRIREEDDNDDDPPELSPNRSRRRSPSREHRTRNRSISPKRDLPTSIQKRELEESVAEAMQQAAVEHKRQEYDIEAAVARQLGPRSEPPPMPLTSASVVQSVSGENNSNAPAYKSPMIRIMTLPLERDEKDTKRPQKRDEEALTTTTPTPKYDPDEQYVTAKEALQDHKEFCFACWFHPLCISDFTRKQYKKLKEKWKEAISTLSPLMACRTIRVFYDRRLRRKWKRKDQLSKSAYNREWTERSIYAHFVLLAREPDLYMIMIDTVCRVGTLKMATQELFEYDTSTGETRVDDKVLKLLLKERQALTRISK